MNENGPLGKIDHFFWRREYQARGIPHAHCKLWSYGHPKPVVDSDEDVIKFIDAHITCKIPNPELEPELYNLVMRFQVHRCTGSCQRTTRNHNGNLVKKNIFLR